MDVSQALKALQTALPETPFAHRGTPEYAALNGARTYHSGLSYTSLHPACIVQPRSTAEVAAFVSTIRPFILTLTNPTAFAVVGGGRQPAPGCNNIEGGITLNLSLLRGVEVKDEEGEGVVSIGAGERRGNVYEKLGERGLGCAGSRSSEGGIGGLALSGSGLSFFSSREGFICDDVVNFEVVLASGETVNANAKSNQDLWRALRGGGNNLGIVTRFDLRTFPQGPLYGGSVYYAYASFPEQVEALVRELRTPDASPETHLMVSMGFAGAFGPEPMALNQVYYTGPGVGDEKMEGEGKEVRVLEPFTKVEGQIPGMNTLRVHSLVEAAKEQAGEMSVPQRSAYMNTHVKADVGMLQAGADIWTASLGPIKGCAGLICSYTLQPYAVSQLEASAKKGGNSLGLDPSLGPIVSIALLMYWVDAGVDEKILGAAREALENIDREAEARGLGIPFKYMNYAATFQDPIGSYGAENKAKLQAASRKYDPEGVFQKGVPGGWKLFP
ncbi:hypothetical protein F5B20DRAFT_570237 [Whalleya microplaca]|nr:hypothetical protein F5B20DRAFT_570237 [Whalleya microplaca]